MKLTRVQIRNFKSVYDISDRGGDAVDLSLSDGMNTFVGPNNCGKSNLVGAVALSLDPELKFDYEQVTPAAAGARKPRITLSFETTATRGPEATLLQRAHDYERSVHAGRSTHAESGKIIVATTLLPEGRRQVTFIAKGAGAITGAMDGKEYRALLKQFRNVVRFVMVRSGESLESLLQGRFREIMHMVIRDHLSHEVHAADGSRTEYMESLQRELLGPLRDRISRDVGAFFPEILQAQLVPNIPRVDSTLSQADVLLGDAAVTDLHGKGTGVRGTVVAAMLGYLADQTRRSMVFAVEEPEAFLHPAAQEKLRESLEELANREDVTLLVTSHSPFIVSRAPNAQLIELAKNGHGRSRIVGKARGDDPMGERIGGLFRDRGTADALETALSTPANARAVVVVEGYTDMAYLQIAARRAHREDLIEGLHFVPAGGASKVVLQALLHRASTQLPVVVILDDDEMGKVALERLKGVQDGWSKRTLSLRKVPSICRRQQHPLEAEDLWSADLMARAVDEMGADAVLEAKIRCGAQWHFALNQLGKSQIVEWLENNAGAEDGLAAIELLELLNQTVERVERTRPHRGA